MFVKGKTHIRQDLHRLYGGQEQGGISTPVNHPFIILFSGEQGEQYGYQDGWTEEGIYIYTGQGQIGDMQFTHGNKAIRDHVENGEDIFLFEYVDQGVVRYIDQVVFAGYLIQEALDREGNTRNAILFELIPLDSFSTTDEEILRELEQASISELRQRAIDISGDPRPPRESSNLIHYRSEAIKTYVLSRASGVCEACKKEAPFLTSNGRPYLETHHIRRVSDGGPDHPNWVAGICPNCHRRAHYSIDREDFNDSLRKLIREKENKFTSNSKIN